MNVGVFIFVDLFMYLFKFVCVHTVFLFIFIVTKMWTWVIQCCYLWKKLNYGLRIHWGFFPL